MARVIHDRPQALVVGQGFREADLDKLSGFMTGTPIRRVLLFGNKIIGT